MATAKGIFNAPYPPAGSILNSNIGTPGFMMPVTSHAEGDGSRLFGSLSGLAPQLVVQHAGYYYFVSARCGEERWKIFKQVREKNLLFRFVLF